MQESIYVGLDLGSSFCHQSVSKRDGSLGFSRVVWTSEQHLRDLFAALNGEARINSKFFLSKLKRASGDIKAILAAVSIFFLPAAGRSDSVLDCSFYS